MRIIERPKISGEDWFYLVCEVCGERFLIAPQEMNANGKIKCEFCPNICRKEDLKDETQTEEIKT